MAINYVPVENIFSVKFTSEFFQAISKVNFLFDKFFKINSRMENPDGTGKIIDYIELSEYSKQILTISGITIAIVTITLITIGIAILWNQRKIKKQLERLLEEKEQDKPND